MWSSQTQDEIVPAHYILAVLGCGFLIAGAGAGYQANTAPKPHLAPGRRDLRVGQPLAVHPRNYRLSPVPRKIPTCRYVFKEERGADGSRRTRMITEQQLSAYLGKSIAEICPNGFTSDAHNHSAHFVGHALGYTFGATCHLIGRRNGPAATLRTQEIFRACPKVGVWSLRPSTLAAGLVFITRAANVNLAGKVMANVPRKHVGIFVGGWSGTTRTASTRS